MYPENISTFNIHTQEPTLCPVFRGDRLRHGGDSCFWPTVLGLPRSRTDACGLEVVCVLLPFPDPGSVELALHESNEDVKNSLAL